MSFNLDLLGNADLHTLADIREGLLKQATRLQVTEDLTEFPSEIFSVADTLERLDLTGNQLSALPQDFDRLVNLKYLFLANNQFMTLPAVLSACKNLEIVDFSGNQIQEVPENVLPLNVRGLILANNKIRCLPDSMGDFTELQKLILTGNQLADLPESLQACRLLQQLRLADNQFERLPDCVFQLRKLSWLSFSGNPCSPAFEMPETALGLNSEIPHDYSRLGEPPTLKNCTRDYFADDFMMTVAAVQKMALSVVNTLLGLQSDAIMHGDIYAHNVFSNTDADALLKGAGELSSYQGASDEEAAALQRIEVRAFGCLLEDLLGSSCDSDACEEVFEALVLLKNRCMHPKVMARPDFVEIKAALEAL